jgi:hypothetical protein
VVALTLLAAEPAFLKKWASQAAEHSLQQLHCEQHCYHLLGVDIIFEYRKLTINSSSHHRHT